MCLQIDNIEGSDTETDEEVGPMPSPSSAPAPAAVMTTIGPEQGLNSLINGQVICAVEPNSGDPLTMTTGCTPHIP